MVTYAKAVSSTVPRFTPRAHNQAVLSNVITIGTADLTINQTIDIGYLPPSARVTGGSLALTDVDTGTALVIAVGDAADTDRFINGATTGQAAGVVSFGNNATSSKTLAEHAGYTTDTKIFATVITAAGTTAAGTLVANVTYELVEPPLG